MSVRCADFVSVGAIIAPYAMLTSKMSFVLVRSTLALGIFLCACKQPSAIQVKVAPRIQERAAPTPPPEAAESAPHDPFALDETSDDPAAALESMRHNCCDEMPAEELREHTDRPSQAR